MMGADQFADASRAAAKLAAEQTIARRKLPATILRPNACFQNDLTAKAAILDHHLYPTPLGRIGVTSVDARDVAAIAAVELLRRDQASHPLPAETIEVVGPDTFTGNAMSKLWSEVIGTRVSYVGDDLDEVERRMRLALPTATAYDLKLVFRGMVRNGVLGAPDAADQLARRLGRPLRTYCAFAEAMTANG
ncbi:NmrA family transcriptional regulator [Sphingomonas sp. KR1UV-12]|uniref:NmrA family transcriptional regulator n=1 Tax=Sphingomonas aurea TaxID=3063994 RepID=A0ABT9ELB5_9SPHN|nr:NmrA family transcriptional regulator [Sphingomonas sp. KR1UV-12]MDP1027762.1 NmrA family transcriptional regulator [Sphingomonas sp. KR1UV-12]